jgi:hypothetical protein
MSKTRDNSQALAAFIARKTEIDAILARLTALLTGRRPITPGPMSELSQAT